MGKDLVYKTVETVIEQIADSQFLPGQTLPSEVILAGRMGVSRLTIREAVKVLCERGVLRVHHGRGTIVMPLTDWKDMESLIRVRKRHQNPMQVELQLLQMRQILEVEAAGLAARHRSDEQLAQLHAAYRVLDGHLSEGVSVAPEDLIEADVRFHTTLLDSSGNPFIAALLLPIRASMGKSRRLIADLPEVVARSHAMHRKILAAVQVRDPESARAAMRQHMEQLRDDYVAIFAAEKERRKQVKKDQAVREVPASDPEQ